jgi:hypothetical protein
MGGPISDRFDRLQILWAPAHVPMEARIRQFLDHLTKRYDVPEKVKGWVPSKVSRTILRL